MAELEEPLTKLVNDLMDRFEGRDEIDFAAEFSIPFPSHVFLTLLGLPWRRPSVPGHEGRDHPARPRDREPPGSRVTIAHQKATADSIYAYFNDVLDQRQVAGRDDILTTFLHTEVDGHRLTREDILDICFLFFIAGLDTVTASLDCFFAYLARQPEQRRRLAEDPSIIPAAVEELLRWESPVTTVARVAVEDTELGGCPIKAGQHERAHRIGQHRRRRVRRRRRGAPTAIPTATSPSAAASIGAWAHTSPATSCGWRCGSGIGGSPTTRSSPATRCRTRPAYARSTTSR